MNTYIQLHPKDHVLVSLMDMQLGETIEVEATETQPLRSIRLLSDVPKGHKIAISAINQGETVLKYGYPIGIAQSDIEEGQWVHTHNLSTGLTGVLSYNYEPNHEPTPKKAHTNELMFNGYLRDNGDVGIRNEIWIINTVGCINKTCERLAAEANKLFSEHAIDGIHHFAHPYGCSQIGDDLDYTQALLATLCNHPNAGGVLVVGLGCENNQIEEFREAIGNVNPQRIRFMKTQDVDDEIEEGLEWIRQLVEYAEACERQPTSISKLRIGMKCGGSDGLSGITANPLVGTIADRIVDAGGTAILTEVPEMFGAETILMNRAINSSVYDNIVTLINDFKQYYIDNRQDIYENPSPGNKAGGITTLEEKSLGCVQKGGTAPIHGVVDYGEQITKTGLNLVKSPGNDAVSVTALTAAGAHIILFTTGRGNPMGGPVPTLKISTNSELALKKKHWIDFDAGTLLHGKTMAELNNELWSMIVSIASGDMQTKNENYGYREIAIFKQGVTL